MALALVAVGSHAHAHLCPQFADLKQRMMWIRGGTFVMGESTSTINPLRTVSVPDVCADVFEVNVRRYTQCVNAGRCPALDNTCSFSDPEYPAACLTFAAAEAVCAFEGKRLPTQEEWERGARGPTNLVRPTGFNDDVLQLGPHAVGAMVEDVTESPFTIVDAGENVSEWTSTMIGQLRVVRGGSYAWTMPNFAKAARLFSPTVHRKDLGVRCFASSQSGTRTGT